jgi:glutamine cyclotransferase
MPSKRTKKKALHSTPAATICKFRNLFLTVVLCVPLILFIVSHFIVNRQDALVSHHGSDIDDEPHFPSTTSTSTTTTTTPTPTTKAPAQSGRSVQPTRTYKHPTTGNIEWEVLHTFTHDRQAFTQGFQAKNNIMYEGTGLYGRSELRKVEISTGKVLKRTKLERTKFGEGIALMKQDTQIIQLTWKSQFGYIYDTNTFELLRTFHYTTLTNQGWGITYDDKKDVLYVSDGSEYIFTWNSETMKEEQRIQVTIEQKGEDQRQTVPKLNELEYYKGTILANIWYDDRIIQINPTTGHVMKSWNFKSLVRKPQEYHAKQDCLNGIALVNNGETKELYVTGKLWRRVYHVRVPGLLSLDEEEEEEEEEEDKRTGAGGKKKQQQTAGAGGHGLGDVLEDVDFLI